jgi:branched-chain amino acid transport system ATP-binding protein|nr:ATP-binding cassette protein [Aeromicrobium sp.]
MSLSDGLQVDDLHVSYGRAKVLIGAAIEVSLGSVVGLCGRNGAGKTTLLKAVSGVIRRSGDLSLAGSKLSPRADKVARAGIAHVPEGRRLFGGLTARENLMIGAVAVGRGSGEADLDYVASVFPSITRLLDRRAATLSGGEQQIVAISRGLMARPRILMIDEMSLGLSPAAISVLLEALPRMVDDGRLGILLVDQNVRSMFEVCDSVYVLHGGRCLLSEHEEDEAVRSAYLG